jgi:competence protein ComEA
MSFLKEHAFFLLGGACLIVVGIIYVVSRSTEPEIIRNEEIIFQAEEREAEKPPSIIIHIAGAVNNPGVFELPEGARVNDALIIAGGENDFADLERINLAAPLQDGMKIVVPKIGDESDIFIFAEEKNDGLININTASSEELQKLSGVGPVLAQNIIDFREANGNFSSVDELIHVSRIGEATLNRLRDKITVR